MDEDQKPQERKKGKGCSLILLFLGACSFDDVTPDQFITSYGMGMQDSGSFNAWDPVYLDTGDFEMLTFGLAWDIGPRQVQVVQDPILLPVPFQEGDVILRGVEVVTQEEFAATPPFEDVVSQFTGMDLASRILAVVFAITLIVVFRKEIAARIPWGSKT